MEIEERLENLSLKTQIPMSEIKKDFDEIVQAYGGDEKKAYVKIVTLYNNRRQSTLPVNMYTGVVIGYSTPYDMMTGYRKTAMLKYKENKKQAVLDGYVDEEGNVLDFRTELKSGKANVRYGKKMPKVEIKNVFGIAGIDNGKPKFFNLALTGKQIQCDIPLHKPIKF